MPIWVKRTFERMLMHIFEDKIGREIQCEKLRFDILSNNGTRSIIISVFLIPPEIIQIMGSKLMSA